MNLWKAKRNVSVVKSLQSSRSTARTVAQANIAFSQGEFPLDVEGSGEIYTGNLKGYEGRDSVGRHRSLPLLPEGDSRDFTR